MHPTTRPGVLLVHSNKISPVSRYQSPWSNVDTHDTERANGPDETSLLNDPVQESRCNAVVGALPAEVTLGRGYLGQSSRWMMLA